jgi:predicted nucleic acid-binding Zn ribbon protein
MSTFLSKVRTVTKEMGKAPYDDKKTMDVITKATLSLVEKLETKESISMTYTYECTNSNCSTTQVDITKPMSECSREEFCSECGHKLSRIFKANINLRFDGSYNNSNHK